MGSDNICPRCGQSMETASMSWFEPVMICKKCGSIEERHPLCPYAKRIEREHVYAGDVNFPGIGLPPGYGEYSEKMLKAFDAFQIVCELCELNLHRKHSCGACVIATLRRRL